VAAALQAVLTERPPVNGGPHPAAGAVVGPVDTTIPSIIPTPAAGSDAELAYAAAHPPPNVRRRPGRPARRPTLGGDVALANIAQLWAPYCSIRWWTAELPEAEIMERRLLDHIDQARTRGCTWHQIGHAMGGQKAPSALEWWQRRNLITPVRRRTKT
jgi:hypothetical protein